MGIFARIEAGTVAELATPLEGFSISECYAPGLIWVEVTNLTPQPQPTWTATETSGGWLFAPPPPPVIPPAVLADLELTARVAAGIAITSTGLASLSATYSLDQTTLDQIGSVARDANSGLGLPDDLETFTYPDKLGVPHDFSEARVIALYKAMRNLTTKLNTQASVMAHGGTPVWPAQTGTIP